MRAADSRSCSCQVISIENVGTVKRQKVEEWLRQEIIKQYGDGCVLDNPLLRIATLFDNLSHKAQYELFEYAKSRILGIGQELELRDKLWSVLQKGGSRDGSWNDVEEFAGHLICKENVYKKSLEKCMGKAVQKVIL